MVQLQAPYQLYGTFTQKKDAPLQRGEGARGLNIKRLSHSEDAPCRSLDTAGKGNLTKLVRPGLGAARVSSAMAIQQRESSRHGELVGRGGGLSSTSSLPPPGSVTSATVKKTWMLFRNSFPRTASSSGCKVCLSPSRYCRQGCPPRTRLS